MAASKKDFEMIAGVFARMHLQRALTHREHTLLANISLQLASRFRTSHAQFDNEKFLEASEATRYLRG